MTINYDVLYDSFGWNSELYEIAEGVLERMDCDEETDDLYDEIFRCMDDELIYTETQWRLMMAYQTPQEANFNEAWEMFEGDLIEAVNNGALSKGDE